MAVSSIVVVVRCCSVYNVETVSALSRDEDVANSVLLNVSVVRISRAVVSCADVSVVVEEAIDSSDIALLAVSITELLVMVSTSKFVLKSVVVVVVSAKDASTVVLVADTSETVSDPLLAIVSAILSVHVSVGVDSKLVSVMRRAVLDTKDSAVLDVETSNVVELSAVDSVAISEDVWITSVVSANDVIKTSLEFVVVIKVDVESVVIVEIMLDASSAVDTTAEIVDKSESSID